MSIATAGRFLVLPAAFFAGCWFNLPEARTGAEQYHSAAARNTKVLQGFRSGQLDDVVLGFGRLVPQAGKAAQKQRPVDSAHSPHSAHTPLPRDGAGGMRKILFALEAAASFVFQPNSAHERGCRRYCGSSSSACGGENQPSAGSDEFEERIPLRSRNS